MRYSGFAAASGTKYSLTSTLKPPHPVSWISNGGESTMRVEFSYVWNILKETFLSQASMGGAPAGVRT